jgi:hypothetical protein
MILFLRSFPDQKCRMGIHSILNAHGAIYVWNSKRFEPEVKHQDSVSFKSYLISIHTFVAVENGTHVHNFRWHFWMEMTSGIRPQSTDIKSPDILHWANQYMHDNSNKSGKTDVRFGCVEENNEHSMHFSYHCIEYTLWGKLYFCTHLQPRRIYCLKEPEQSSIIISCLYDAQHSQRPKIWVYSRHNDQLL